MFYQYQMESKICHIYTKIIEGCIKGGRVDCNLWSERVSNALNSFYRIQRKGHCCKLILLVYRLRLMFMNHFPSNWKKKFSLTNNVYNMEYTDGKKIFTYMINFTFHFTYVYEYRDIHRRGKVNSFGNLFCISCILLLYVLGHQCCLLLQLLIKEIDQPSSDLLRFGGQL